MRTLYALLFALAFTSCSIERKIIDRPIEFGQERIDLTKEYLKDRYGLIQDNIEIKPQMVVVHWTAIPTYEGSFRAFYPTKLPNSRTAIKGASSLNVSIQFLVSQDGSIYRLMPETWMARHVIGLNHCAIGIENVGGTKETPLTEAQFEANVKLISYLKKKYSIDYLIGHYEYTDFVDHALWLEKDENYRTKKTDPGSEFMRRLRIELAKFKFLENPEAK